MHPLSARDIVHIWEWGRDKHAVDRALTLLAWACPELTPEQRRGLTVGQRNARLLALREKTFGPTLEGFAECAQCHTSLEFSTRVAALRRPEPDAETFDLQVEGLQVEGLEVRFRLLNSLDLAAMVGLAEVDRARHLLIERCVLAATREGRALAPDELPDFARAALVEALAEYDPQAEMRFGLACASCGHRWSVLFDIVSFFWAELGARAKRLLHEVHALARAYSWSEAEILAMREQRRQFYLELVAHG